MLSSLALMGLALPLFSIAAPTQHFTPRVRLPDSLYPRQSNSSSCLTEVQQPANTLPAPGDDTTLVLIALGRGTQNYTCGNASDTAKPTQIGAVADLFNVSCAVASGTLGSITEDAAAVGTHWFVDTTTPDFDIIGLGNTQAKKVADMASPEAGNIAWLKLDAKPESSTSAVKSIYRLHTVGGLAPSSCANVTPGETITVAYEAQYWVYACTKTLNARRQKRAEVLSKA